MMMRRLLMLLLLVVLMLAMSCMVQPVNAQGPIATPPSEPTPITPEQIDALNAKADAYSAKTQAALEQSQSAINSAYAAIASAQAGLSAAQETARSEHAARVAAEQGQIQQAVSSAQAALVAANTAADMSRSANDDAVNAMLASERSQAAVQQLSQGLQQSNATIAALRELNDTQQARIVYLENYGLDQYQRTVTAWFMAGLLGFVIIAIICGALIIFAFERRNRWPKFRSGIDGALIMPIGNSSQLGER
jgi:hypothetical protein